MRKSSPFLAAAALGAMAMALGPGTVISGEGTAQARPTNETRAEQSKRQQDSQRTRNSVERAIFGGYGGARQRHGYPRPGWSVAHGKRLVRKAKNKARNRRAHRG